jgi:hypothetical protein
VKHATQRATFEAKSAGDLLVVGALTVRCTTGPQGLQIAKEFDMLTVAFYATSHERPLQSRDASLDGRIVGGRDEPVEILLFERIHKNLCQRQHQIVEVLLFIASGHTNGVKAVCILGGKR